MVFSCAKNANKLQIKKAVEELYGVTVDSVNTMQLRRQRSRPAIPSQVSWQAKQQPTKKAVVTLAEGETIDFYSNI
ncbi:MAG: 50S ribosomal protein L23 [Marinilabiliales bacterium]|nr:50S ribosomal protein L23 [Marinilabiliales bacterium]